MRILIWIFLLLILMLNFSYASERDISMKTCQAIGGIPEVRTPSGLRVDCLTDIYAMEFEWPKKWAEAIGQALAYGSEMKRVPVIVFIGMDRRHIERALYVIRSWHLPIQVWVYENGLISPYGGR